MIRLFKKKDSDYLSNQAPRKRRLHKRTLSPRKSTTTVILTVFTLSALYFLYSKAPTLSPSALNLTGLSTPHNIVVVSSRETPLSKDKESRIISRVKRIPWGKTFVDMSLVAKKVHLEPGFEQVRVTQNHPGSLLVFVKERSPAMLIKTRKMRLLSAQGEVYGSPTPTEQKALPLLDGVLESKTKKRRLLPNNQLKTTLKEQQNILAALNLYKLLKEHNIPISKLIYKDHRGYFTHLVKDDILVAFGLGLFEKKIKKLKKALKLHSTTKPIERIDLDYLGKTFIKRKTA